MISNGAKLSRSVKTSEIFAARYAMATMLIDRHKRPLNHLGAVGGVVS